MEQSSLGKSGLGSSQVNDGANLEGEKQNLVSSKIEDTEVNAGQPIQDEKSFENNEENQPTRKVT